MQNYGKQMIKDGNVYYLSGFDFEKPEKDNIHGLISKRAAGEKIDKVDIELRMNVSETGLSRIIK